MADFDDTLLARFWEKVERRGGQECWPWLAHISADGHGKFQIGKRNVTAHRVAYQIAHGPIPAGKVVRHACHHADCQNPAHLSLGTTAENNADRKAAGRYGSAFGWAPRLERPRLAERVQQKMGPPPAPVMDRLLAGRIIAASGCWEWTRAKAMGYGVITINRKMIKLHRLSYVLFIGPIPDGAVVRHKCDNRACFNPEHLCVGTHKDNMRDMAERGRAATGKKNHFGRVKYSGPDNGNSKLTEDQVRAIRASREPYSALMLRYGMSKPAISHIKRRRTWAHVLDIPG